MDGLLAECGFEPLYPADPYDCFILICILSVDPMGTYADVLELSKELRLLEASQLNYAGKLGLTPESRVRLAQKIVPPETDPDDDLYGD